MTRRELGSFASVLAMILGATSRVLGLLIAVGITDGTILGIAGSGVITATTWVIERRSF